ncbi:hypothetical protein TNCV_2638541 [Trichonephila clavipes]|nr:hypothetical protein TNCV_2638541 [Trichonephila clavipes]
MGNITPLIKQCPPKFRYRWEVFDGMQFVGQAYPTHALLESSPVSMLAGPYGGYPPIEGIRLQCLHYEDERCHP